MLAALTKCSIKAKKAKCFHQPHMFHKVTRILEQHNYRLPVLRFVMDLFDRSVLRRIVLEEEEEDGTEESASDDEPTANVRKS